MENLKMVANIIKTPAVSLALLLVIIGASFGQGVSYGKRKSQVSVAYEPASRWTDGAVWAALDREAGTLTFFGRGAVNDTNSWLDLSPEDRVKIRKVVFGRGITNVGEFEFKDIHLELPNLSSVVFEGDISMIGWGAFADNVNLSSVEFRGSCRAIGPFAFKGCVSLTRINIPAGCSVDSSAIPTSTIVIKVEQQTTKKPDANRDNPSPRQRSVPRQKDVVGGECDENGLRHDTSASESRTAPG